MELIHPCHLYEPMLDHLYNLLNLLAPDGGFILSPVDNVREVHLIAKKNVMAMIDEWQLSQG